MKTEGARPPLSKGSIAMFKKIAVALVAASLLAAPAFAQGNAQGSATPAVTQHTKAAVKHKVAVKAHKVKRHASLHHRKHVKHVKQARHHVKSVKHHASRVKHYVKKAG